jgi:hypothetical protein
MIPSKECVKHAARSEHMAMGSRDPECKAIWSRMAQRWIQRAEMSVNNTQVAVVAPAKTKLATESA